MTSDPARDASGRNPKPITSPRNHWQAFIAVRLRGITGR